MKKFIAFISNVLFIGKHRRAMLVTIDTAIFAFVDGIAFLLMRYSFGGEPSLSVRTYVLNSLVIYACFLCSRFTMKIYSNIWRYPNTKAYFYLVVSDCVAGILSISVSALFSIAFDNFYQGIWHALITMSLTAILTLVSRFIYRIIYKVSHSRTNTSSGASGKTPIAIIGAGQLGAYLANELLFSSKSTYVPKCFIDCDKEKIGNKVANLPIIGEDSVEDAKEKYGFREVVIAILGLEREEYKNLWHKYESLGCKVKIYDLPVNDGIDAGDNGRKIIRDFSIEDLLFRKPLTINHENEFKFYTDKTVLVTGGGGSIGSEICRQIAKCSPKKLIIFDIYENNAYDIQQELSRKHGTALDLEVEIGSVRDVARLDAVFAYYRPEIVFHAAAHKHVPLMEHSGCEAIKNNVIGTYNTANMAEKYGTRKFILISTDKAVNPTNIMGASKRLCEMVIQCRTDSNTSFAAVRFGNVLGSNGSVIPLFKRQILAGGPVTITDKRIIRYFMTIPEASQLVIQAGAAANKGDLFVLDMGQPVRIYDLAFNMIKLMGYTPGEDIEIKEIGLRPGEKLYEELLMKTETLAETENKMIFIERDTPYTRDAVEKKLDILRAAVERAEGDVASNEIKEAIRATVPTFIDPDDINNKADESDEMKQAKKKLATV